MRRLDDATISAFIDGELDPAAAAEVATAVRSDAETRHRAARLRRATVLAKAAFDSPFMLRSCPELAAAIDSAAARRERKVRYRIGAAAMAASVFLLLSSAGIGAFLGMNWPASPAVVADRLMEEVAGYHAVYARENEHRVEVRAERVADIEAWLGERLHRNVRVPDLTRRGYEFQGARLLGFDGRPMAELFYARPDQPDRPLGVCIGLGEPGDDEVRTDVKSGITVATWRRDEYIYVLAGWDEEAMLADLARDLGRDL